MTRGRDGRTSLGEAYRGLREKDGLHPIKAAYYAPVAVALLWVGNRYIRKKFDRPGADRVTDGGRDIVQNPRIESQVSCGHCGAEWWESIDTGRDHYEIECPGCGETWTTEKEGRT